jgi:hypothetical protein
MLRGNLVSLCSRTEMSKNKFYRDILLRSFVLENEHSTLKILDMIIQSSSVISQINGITSYTAVKTSKYATFSTVSFQLKIYFQP